MKTTLLKTDYCNECWSQSHWKSLERAEMSLNHWGQESRKQSRTWTNCKGRVRETTRGRVQEAWRWLQETFQDSHPSLKLLHASKKKKNAFFCWITLDILLKYSDDTNSVQIFFICRVQCRSPVECCRLLRRLTQGWPGWPALFKLVTVRYLLLFGCCRCRITNQLIWMSIFQVSTYI